MHDLGDYKIIVYIILAILYFLFKGKKKEVQKNNPPVAQKEIREENPPVYSPKPISSQRKSSSPKPSPVSNPEPYSLEDILRQYGPSPEKPKSPETKEAKYETLEKPKTNVIDYDDDLEDEVETLNKKSNTVSIEDINKEEHLIPYVSEKQAESKYAAMLKDPEGVKTAFIAGEIFNRKY